VFLLPYYAQYLGNEHVVNRRVYTQKGTHIVTSEFKKTTIEIESVTTTGSAFASSCEGSVFVPAKIVEQSDVQEGDIIYATIR
jgi:hypothetical protein